MTRLAAGDIDHIADSLSGYDQDLRARTGSGLRGLACNAVGVQESMMTAILNQASARIVPVNWGAGQIRGFAAAVAAILNWIGLAARVTGGINVGGFVEAVESNCDLIFISDDDDFAAFNLARKKSVHNAAATGRGFAAGLDLMAGGLHGREALVLGCGPVGVNAAAELLRRGARVTAYDPDPVRRRTVIGDRSIAAMGDIFETENPEAALRQHDCIVDATPVADIIGPEMIGPQTFVAAPGMPLGLTAAAVEKTGLRLLHDPLQIGVATMAVEALARASETKPGSPTQGNR